MRTRSLVALPVLLLAATFAGAQAPARDTVTLTVVVRGSGTVTSKPAGIQCSSNPATSCKADFKRGTKVTLTGAVLVKEKLVGWTGPCARAGEYACTYTANNDATVTANYRPK